MDGSSTCQQSAAKEKFIGLNWEEIERNCLANKMAAARSILITCRDNKPILERECKTQDDLEKIIRDVTHIDINTIRSFMFSIQPRHTFEHYLSQSTQSNSKVSHDCLRDIIYTSYLKDGIVPTTENILHRLKTNSSEYGLKDLTKDLKINGFTLQKLGNTRKALIVEEPEQIYRRMKYLNKVRNYRMQNKNFAYISFKTDFFLAFSPYAGIFKTESNDKSNSPKIDRALDFMHRFIFYLSRPSVVILDGLDNLFNKNMENKTVYCGRDKDDLFTKQSITSKAPPNEHSSKQEMKNWLSFQNIPFEDQAHTAELFAFIQKFRKTKKDTCEIRSLLENHGFEVLQVPREVSSLNFFHPIFKQIEGLHFMPEIQYLRSIFGKCTRTQLSVLEDSLKNEENNVYSKDLEFEKVIDTIRFAATQTVFVPQDLKSCANYGEESTPSYIVLD